MVWYHSRASLKGEEKKTLTSRKKYGRISNKVATNFRGFQKLCNFR